MSWKLIVLGGIAYFVTAFVVSMATGQVIHTGLLDGAYRDTVEFWRPQLTSDPPDMGALMPMWILNGLIGGIALATLYGWVRGAFSGAPWQKGLSYGVFLTIIYAVTYLSLSGVFALPGNIWFWWAIDALIISVVAAIVLAIVAQKVAPEPVHG